MFPSFLPDRTAQLTEATSTMLAQNIQRQSITTPLSLSAIDTAFVHQGQGGTPIVLLHGFDSSVLEFRRLLPLLAASQETWAIDLLGFGFTDRAVDLSFDPESIKTHLYYTWKTCIGRPMVLVGASMGGAAAIDFALTYPDAVAQLVLLDSAGFAKSPVLSKFLFPPLGYLATEFLRQPKVRQQVSLKAYYDPRFVTPDAELCAALHLELPRWSQALIAFTKSGGYGFLSDRIAQVSVPTLIVWGRQDGILGIRDADRFHTTIPQSQLLWVDQCGHVPHLEKPQETADHLLSFIHSS
ncbi:alpha/beta fold hydrolase [Alkalinema sp. FACHB-956]|uniref:alpha/beta fold hydrolase n=1 Tax=Alkalinema sp. FACHB-956 TaxID=2692768 RepID=UPI001681E0D9|nr:alpha/beta fold hydrolase [Alkalinema sp. FACHB-956]MBD2329049.1 alpha/beta fold hydrolase [Alkalinema sp. FACHB-956]